MRKGERTDAKAPAARPEEWFRWAFDEFYVHLYAHRDEAEAETLVRTLRQRIGLAGPVLDVACGPGRFLRALACAGIDAVGLDLSRPLLREARERLSPARLIRADMRWMPVRPGSFACALLLFTSFGYFALESEDHAVLAEIHRVLRPRGRIVLDFLNSAKAAAELVPESRREVCGRRVVEARWIDAAGPFLRKRVEVGGRPALVYEERVRLYSPEQLRELLAGAGFEVEAALGDYAGAPFSKTDSPRCVLIGRKQEG